MMKFTISCEFGDKKRPFALYIGNPRHDRHPLENQQHWLQANRGGEIPQDVMSSFQKLHDIAFENGVCFEELSAYALTNAKEEKEQEEQQITNEEAEKDEKKETKKSLIKLEELENHEKCPSLDESECRIATDEDECEIESQKTEVKTIQELEDSWGVTGIKVGSGYCEQLQNLYKFAEYLFPESNQSAEDAKLLMFAVAGYLFTDPNKSASLPELYRTFMAEDFVYSMAVVLDTVGGKLNPMIFQTIASFLYFEKAVVLHTVDKITARLIRFSLLDEIPKNEAIYQKWQRDMRLVLSDTEEIEQLLSQETSEGGKTKSMTEQVSITWQPSEKVTPDFDLDQELYRFNGIEPFTTRQACEGVQIFGGVGAGKTSGSGAALAHAYLRAGFGGLVLCAKPEVLEEWKQYAIKTGREKDLIIMDVDGSYCFPFMQYEVNREGEGAGFTENVLRIFTSVFNAINRTDSSKDSSQYWVRSMQQLLRNTIDLCLLARNEVSLPLIQKVISSAPYSLSERDSNEWREESLCWQLLNEANNRERVIWEQYDFDASVVYWMEEFPKLAPRTRSSIVSMLTSMLDGLLRRPFRMLFSELPQDSQQVLYPELSHEGKIIILNLPVKEFGEIGRAVQIIYKYIWQQAAERRNIQDNPRPVFLWVDEAQYFATDYDMEFQTTARSSRACTVYITQNLPNYYAQMGQNNSYFVDSLINNLQTKIWHANSDPMTNKNAAEIIGKSWVQVSALNYDMGPALDKKPLSQTVSESYQYDVGHKHFTQLKKGGPENEFLVDAIVFQNGRKWNNEENHFQVTFDQREPDGFNNSSKEYPNDLAKEK